MRSLLAIVVVVILTSCVSTNGGTGKSEFKVHREAPKYPSEAARNNVSGWVKLRFDITLEGTVENIKVIEAEPKDIFNKSAKRALSKWTYKPKVVDGQAVSQKDLEVTLTFKLANKSFKRDS